MTARRLTFPLVLGLLTFMGGPVHADGFVIIRNTKDTSASIRANELRAMFTGRTKQWRAGALVQVVLPSEGCAATRWLAESIFGVPGKVLLTKIRQEVFKGEMKKPLSAASDAELIEAVKNHPGSIATVAAEAAKSLPDGVAVLAIN